ncbi:uncharacterized protein LOC106866457 [Brachypodium distachyon]|uniref:Uncharacterized protein n=1 Tax=Brachypodium distachyon TaxID=15368 RepID=A0A0Q3F651_BRADI|nr:uncharacterized protein LOC106866457 [Brachypodium distachyon]KQJ93692.1 hypothetical protein BRADI_3g06175v3 [Brachypodium distachyon]|eukprot:XP_014756186.1 uncharacterized protein LOC106866457 [Brachypodium distachyon]
MEMEAGSSSSLRRRLRATVCCCFGLGYGGYGGYRARREGAGGEFRYDSLSYALNFDEGPDDLEDDAGAGLLCRSFSSPPRALARTPAAA